MRFSQLLNKMCTTKGFREALSPGYNLQPEDNDRAC